MPFLLMLAVFTFVVGLFFPPLLLVTFLCVMQMKKTGSKRVNALRDADEARRQAQASRFHDRQVVAARRYFA